MRQSARRSEFRRGCLIFATATVDHSSSALDTIPIEDDESRVLISAADAVRSAQTGLEGKNLGNLLESQAQA